MGSTMAIIGAAAATVAVVKLLTSRRGSFVMPGIRITWGRWYSKYCWLDYLIYPRY